jgi:hypothetical protein
MEEAARLGPTTPFPRVKPFTTSLHAGKPPEPPHKPAAPSEPPTTGIVPAELYKAPAAVAAPATGFEVKPVWQALLDVSVWRTRRWWRMAASLVVRRPGH